jgi:galactokinase
MPSLKRIHRYLNDDPGISFLEQLYGREPERWLPHQKKCHALLEQFETEFPGHEQIEVCSAPGRTELGGNHTDHENGRVLSAAVDLDAVAVAGGNDRGVIRLLSDGYRPMEIDLDRLKPDPEERTTSQALVRGICNHLFQAGYAIGGFDARLTSSVPTGSGLSSSAAFELLVGVVISSLFNHSRIDPLTLAQAAQSAERRYFGKPCGLMDQLTCAVGGFVTIDFARPERPVLRPMHFDLSESGYALVVVGTGGSHADLTEEYAAIKEENQAVAHFFRKEVLREVDERKFRAQLEQLRSRLGDRALLRAMHFYDEDRRVVGQVEALESGNFERFLELVNASGRSSWMLLQNCFSGKTPQEQGVPLALALTARFLEQKGACRVHGGGFAGTIQAYIPQGRLKAYIRSMERVFGAGSCRLVRIRPVGATRLPVPED